MKNIKKIILGIVFLGITLIIAMYGVFLLQTSKVSNNNENKDFLVENGSTFLTITKSLKENNLIKSEFFYKLYVKVYKPKGLQFGKYELKENMSVKEIIKTLSKGSNYNPDVITVTIPEGKNLKEIAKIIASKTNNTEKELLTSWNNKEFIPIDI